MVTRVVVSARSVSVTSALVAAYAASVGVDGESVPPLFSIIAGYPLLFDTVASVTPARLRERTVHGAHEVTVIRPVVVGDVLRAQAVVEAVRGSTPGTSVVVRIDIHDGTDALVAAHRAVAIVRGAQPDAEFGPPVARPGAEPEQWLGTGVVSLAADQPMRYAEATGDVNAVHVDDDAARRASFPGVIAHGLGVFGLVLGELTRQVAPDDPARVRRARVRFGPPVRPGQDLTLQWADRGAGGTGGAVAFRALDESGAAVLRSGELELG